MSEEFWKEHVPCTNEQHDPAKGLISGYCVRCRLPWPCKWSPESRLPDPPAEAASSSKFTSGYSKVEPPVGVLGHQIITEAAQSYPERVTPPGMEGLSFPVGCDAGLDDEPPPQPVDWIEAAAREINNKCNEEDCVQDVGGWCSVMTEEFAAVIAKHAPKPPDAAEQAQRAAVAVLRLVANDWAKRPARGLDAIKAVEQSLDELTAAIQSALAPQ